MSSDHLNLSRRDLLRGGLVLGGTLAISTLGDPTAISAAARVRAAGSDLGAVEHVIFVMLENRSFDHYFGTYPNVRGFDDHSIYSDGPFAQSSPSNLTQPPLGVQLPFHLDTSAPGAECTHDIDHSWLTQHLCWNSGKMDSFVSTHTLNQSDGPRTGLLTMGYYTRRDLPYHYALADAFTICDSYFCSVLGPTHPNRLMSISGSIDPGGLHGGPILDTSDSQSRLFSLHWTSIPEILQDRGISWKTYTTPGQGFLPGSPELGFGNAILQFFAPYKNPRSALFQKAFLPSFPSDFANDVRTGRLPKVSWITPPNGYDEHPPSPPSYGAIFIDRILRTLISNPKVWSKTVMFISYDENGGFFDHVPPPTPPAGTPGEFITAAHTPIAAQSVLGPIGLGFRVPMFVVSPFSRGGHIASQVFDHTSQLQFLEKRFGFRAPNISNWRRLIVGDLTSTLHMGQRTLKVPKLPATATYKVRAINQLGCTPSEVAGVSGSAMAFPLPSSQTMPVQEP